MGAFTLWLIRNSDRHAAIETARCSSGRRPTPGESSIEPLGAGSTDELVLGDINVFLRFVELPRWQAHLGGGVRFLIDGVNDDPVVGLNGTLSVEGYPHSPLTLRGVIDAGNLGPALFLEGQVTAGVMLNRLELFAGYSGMRIGPVGFYGPLAGLRLHL